MQSLTRKVFELAPPGGLFDETVVRNCFPELKPGARKAMVLRAVKSGEVLRLKPGLFCLDAPFRRTHPHPFAVAGMLHSPSHVSLESALQYHGLIPEAVYEVASVTSRRSRRFANPLGSYSFTRVPADGPFAGIRSVQVDAHFRAFVASGIRAIADLVYLRKEVRWDADGIGFLVDSMRIDLDALRQVDTGDAEAILRSMRNRRTRAYLAGLYREIGL